MKAKILIVEDQFIEANNLQMILERAGYTVCSIARSVPIALKIIEKENPDALAKAIIHLAKDKELRISLGRNGIEHAKQNFASEKNIKKIEAIYQKVLNEK